MRGTGDHPGAIEPVGQALAPRVPARADRRLPMSSSSWSTTSPSSDWRHPPTMRPSHQAVGPALPLVSNRSALCGPRYQSRSNHPIVVGSSGGKSAAHGSTGSVGSRSSREHVADAARHRDRPRRRRRSASAVRTAGDVEPSHHLMSAVGAGPERRGATVRPCPATPSAAEAGGSLLPEPRPHGRPAGPGGRPRAVVEAPHDVTRRRERGQHSWTDRHLAAPGPTLPVGDRAFEQRDLVAKLRRRGLSPVREERHDVSGGVGQPAFTVAVQARSLDVADEPDAARCRRPGRWPPPGHRASSPVGRRTGCDASPGV